MCTNLKHLWSSKKSLGMIESYLDLLISSLPWTFRTTEHKKNRVFEACRAWSWGGGEYRESVEGKGSWLGYMFISDAVSCMYNMSGSKSVALILNHIFRLYTRFYPLCCRKTKYCSYSHWSIDHYKEIYPWDCFRPQCPLLFPIYSIYNSHFAVGISVWPDWSLRLNKTLQTHIWCVDGRLSSEQEGIIKPSAKNAAAEWRNHWYLRI